MQEKNQQLADYGRQGMASRWGGRGKSKLVRVDPDAADLLARIPERDRRRVASTAVRTAAKQYLDRRG